MFIICRSNAFTVYMWLASSLCCCRGFLGSGICVFSRYPILETVEHRFPLNGHPQKILHGDFYGNKACGLLILKVKDLNVNLYTTHVSLYSEFKYSERILYSSELNIRYFCWKSNFPSINFPCMKVRKSGRKFSTSLLKTLLHSLVSSESKHREKVID